jgi:D-arabinose 1-dehydrogenase-like Zn-dependent alcohol dehydrogenase
VRAMAITSYDAPLERIDAPEPELGPGHALIEVLTCGVCFSDVKTWRGKMPYSDGLQLPHIPGHEVCGRVMATDPDGALPHGARVVAHHVWPCRVCARCRAGEDNICTNPQAWPGFTQPGGFRERMMVPLDRLVRVPEGIPAPHAAPMTCALGTAYRATITKGEVRAGTRAAVIGLGGVGIHALQIAHAAGARALGLDVSDAALEVAGSLGIDARRADDPDVRRSVLDDSGEGLDVVIDTVGHADTIERANELVRPGGRIVALGYSMTESFVIHSPRFVLEEVQLIGSRYVRLHELESVIRMVAEGRVQTVVDRVEPLEAVNEAFAALESGEVVGRVVLDVAGVS